MASTRVFKQTKNNKKSTFLKKSNKQFTNKETVLTIKVDLFEKNSRLQSRCTKVKNWYEYDESVFLLCRNKNLAISERF